MGGWKKRRQEEGKTDEGEGEEREKPVFRGSIIASRRDTVSLDKSWWSHGEHTNCLSFGFRLIINTISYKS